MTGNTEKAAKAIQKGMEQAAGNCDIFPIKEANPHKLAGYDLIGFGYPLMGPMLKTNIINFIDELRYVGGKPIQKRTAATVNNKDRDGRKYLRRGKIDVFLKSGHLIM
jgi:flavodoxin